MIKYLRNFYYIAPYFLLASTSAFSQDKVFIAPDVNIISVSPVQGSGMSIDRVPANVQNFGEEALSDKKNFSVVETLNRKAAGISIGEYISEYFIDEHL